MNSTRRIFSTCWRARSCGAIFSQPQAPPSMATTIKTTVSAMVLVPRSPRSNSAAPAISGRTESAARAPLATF